MFLIFWFEECYKKYIFKFLIKKRGEKVLYIDMICGKYEFVYFVLS